MTTSGPPRSLDRWTSWLQATPAELVGLALLLLGGLAVAGLLWWDATQRPTDLPEDAGDGGVALVGGAVGSVAGESGAGDAGVGDSHLADGGAWAAGDQVGPGEELGRHGDDASDTGGPVVVHVSGAVARPGLVTLPAGARVGDAVAAAGGALDGADTARVNLARPLQDGEHVHLPLEGEELPPGWDATSGRAADSGAAGTGAAGGGGGGTTSDGRIDLNRASASELETLPGIGPARAQAIVEHREGHGPFREPGDLRAVPGIGEKTFQRLADLVTVS
jgi:competence protein ComEA